MLAKSIPENAIRWGIIGLIIVIIAFLFQGRKDGFFNIGISTGTTTENIIGTYYKVTKVIDGDTFHIDFNGTDEKVRLIGINTPETVDERTSVQCFGKEASTRMKELIEGQIVRLEFDEAEGMRDIYNRLLAYVYLEDGQMINRKMIAEGYAYEYTYMTAYKYQKEFRQIQNLARSSLRGLWAKETCNGKKNIQK